MLGLDGSRESAGAAELAAQVAEGLGVEVVAVHARLPHQGHDRVSALARLDEAERQRLDQWSEPLKDCGITTTAVSVVNTDPAAAVLDLAHEKKASVVVIGTRGTGGFSGLRFGGQAMRTLHRAALPLILVPPRRSEPAA
ncbi:MAG: universal stress protein [Acidimicrobiales bacterium]